MFCWQLNYDGLDDDDDDQFSSVYCFAIKIYKTRSSKYLKDNGKEAHRAYKERAPSIKYYNNYYNHDDDDDNDDDNDDEDQNDDHYLWLINKCSFALDLKIALLETLACINEDISCRQRLIP